MSGDIAVIGPLARSAKDLDLVLQIAAKPPKPMQRAFRIELPPPRKQLLTQYRVGIWLDDRIFRWTARWRIACRIWWTAFPQTV
ncbi:MAG: hypothetical protein R2860_01190 [Desulfobacterales bacterium]